MQIWSFEQEEDMYKLPDITEEQIEEIEKLLKKKIPKAYKKIILEQNGGYLEYSSVIAELNENEKKILPIDHIYGLGKEGVLSSNYLIDEWGLPSGILIFSGDGNSFYALDYRKNFDFPTVIYLEPDTESEILVANTFDDFLKNLSQEVVYFEADENDNDWEKLSIESVEEIFTGNDIMLIEEALLECQYPDNHKWYFEQLLKLSTHGNLLVRQTVTSILGNNLEYYVGDTDKKLHHLIEEIIRNLTSDQNLDIKTEALEIEKRLMNEFF